MDNNLCIVIKAPNQKYDDLKVKCEPTWTILDLKKHLCTEYPSKPKLGDQRLIYSGHLLKDTQHLNEVIGPSDDNQHTFHLVVPHRATGPTNSSAASTSSASNEATTTNNNNNNNSNPTNNAGPNNVQPNTGLGPNWPYEIPPMLRTAYRPILSNDNNLIPEAHDPMIQQYMQWMTSYYHMYPPSSLASYETYMLNHYYYSYRQLHRNNNNNRTNENPLNGNVNNNNNNDNNNNNNNNNELDAEEGGDRGNRNWAETMASLSKVVLLMGIIYFYTSLSRLLLLALIVLIVYLYRYVAQQNDMLNNNNNNNQPQQPQPQPPPPPPQAVFQGQPDEVNNNNNEPDGQAPRDGELNNFEDGSTNVRVNGLRLVWVFVSSLFTSLIPDPVPMN